MRFDFVFKQNFPYKSLIQNCNQAKRNRICIFLYISQFARPINKMYIYIYIYIQETKFEYITMKIKNKTGNIVQSSYLAASVNIIITKQKGNYV